MASVISRAARFGVTAIADLLVPRRCGLCGAFGAFLCPGCRAALPRITGPICASCGDATAGGALCARCAAASNGQPLLDAVVAACRFEGPARDLVHRLKYERLSALAAPMGAVLAEAAALGRLPDLLVPVPLHPRRQRDRGFNQAAELAAAAGAVLGVGVAPRLLARVRPTAQQARQPNAAARAANVAGAFAVRPRGGPPLTGRSVALVDDVVTTGATVGACAAALRQAGTVEVMAWAFAHG